MRCRHCESQLNQVFCDLGIMAPSNSYLAKNADKNSEKKYPLRVLVCENCWLVQTEDFAEKDVFFSENYAYFSSFSKSWLNHAKSYVDTMVERFQLDENSTVAEIAANDGYLLQYVKAHSIKCYGVEPTKSTAIAAKKLGLEIVEDFFGEKLAKELAKNGKRADLMVANNVLAHVPDINDFVKGFTRLLKPRGVVTFEFPHLMPLIEENQFDTIYHEHFSYLSLTTVKKIFEQNGLSVFDVEKLSTHGGSLRVFAQISYSGIHKKTTRLHEILTAEKQSGINNILFYQGFQKRIDGVVHSLKEFVSSAERNGKTIAAYGAAAKGNTLLNYAGIDWQTIEYVVDSNPAKQGFLMPGNHIPIVKEDCIKKSRPDYILILPWNLAGEIESQLSYIREWDGKFVTAIPELKVF